MATGVRWGHADYVQTFVCRNYIVDDPVPSHFRRAQVTTLLGFLFFFLGATNLLESWPSQQYLSS